STGSEKMIYELEACCDFLTILRRKAITVRNIDVCNGHSYQVIRRSVGARLDKCASVDANGWRVYAADFHIVACKSPGRAVPNSCFPHVINPVHLRGRMAIANPLLLSQLHGSHKSHLHSGQGSDRSSRQI